MSCKLFLFTFITICFSLRNADGKNENGNHEWDILIFTQQWPDTVCKEMQKHHHSKCAMPAKRDSWSIHGIWPTKLGTIGPGFCNRTWLFDPEQVRPIEKDLMQVWTNIDAGSQPYSFWSHEWSKHGTCAAVLEPLNGEFKYFNKGLEWLGEYSMTDILADGKITPSNTQPYKIIDIHNAIKQKLGINAAIECDKEKGVSTIVEIRICFDKNLNLHDCNGIKTPRLTEVLVEGESVLTNCDPSQDVLYPHYSQTSTVVQLYKLVQYLKWLTL